ncbi:Venom metalloproteinase 3 [Gryllus bimaculatus]|nr:Venom metalloproteinase 3 [Gryllus bimaculatus]
MEPDLLLKRVRRARRGARTSREAPYVIYPEILVIVDYDGYRLHGGDNVQIKRYFVSFWNGVDLRYKLLKGPKIRISIAGIIISRGRDATPYLERNRVGRDAIDSAAALTDMGKYLFRERRLPVYDIAVAITKYDMCRRRKGGRCTKGTAGFAYVGGACVVNKRLEKVNSVAIIEDTGGFSGIIVGAHEVGHLGDTATCLYNSPHEDESLPRVLPGKLLTLDAQCRKDRGTSACFMTVFVLNYFALMLARDTVWPIDQLQKVLLVEMGRSPWDGRGWGSSSTYAPDVSRSTTPNTQRPTNYYNTYSTTTENPYYQFNRPTQNPNAPNQSPGNIFDKEGRQRTSVTTIKNPYSVDISPLRPSTTKNPYDFSNLHQFRKQSSNRNPTSQNPYQQQSVNTYRPNPYQPYNAYHASNNEPISIYGNASNVTTNSNVASNTTIVTESVAGTECEDKVTDIAGSMTCREFLSHYGFQYCSYRYMQQNCCKSQKEVCEGRNWRKRK